MSDIAIYQHKSWVFFDFIDFSASRTSVHTRNLPAAPRSQDSDSGVEPPSLLDEGSAPAESLLESAHGSMATVATRPEKTPCQTKRKQFHLTPTGLLMEGDYTSVRFLFAKIGGFECNRDLSPIGFLSANAPEWQNLADGAASQEYH